MITELLKDADMSNFPNHITFYGKNYRPGIADDKYKEYRRKWVEYSKECYVSGFPLHLDIEVTNRCNIRCTMCFVDFSVDKGEFIDVALFKKVIDEGAKHGLPSVKYNYRG